MKQKNQQWITSGWMKEMGYPTHHLQYETSNMVSFMCKNIFFNPRHFHGANMSNKLVPLASNSSSRRTWLHITGEGTVLIC